MSNIRIWLFRILSIATAGFMTWTWFMPWWSANIKEVMGTENVIIHPWGLEINMGSLGIFAEPGQMPGWFSILMFVYLGLAIVGVIIGIWLQGKHIRLFGREYNMSSFLIGLVGVSYIICLLVATVFAAIRTGDFYNMPLQGHIKIDLGAPQISDVDTTLRLGYYLGYSSGVILILLALFRSKITGKN